MLMIGPDLLTSLIIDTGSREPEGDQLALSQRKFVQVKAKIPQKKCSIFFVCLFTSRVLPQMLKSDLVAFLPKSLSLRW